MNSRERVLTAMSLSEPDKVPIDFGGHRSSGISAIAYAKLKNYLGISSGDIYVYDMPQQLAIVEEPVLEAFGVDTIEMGRAFMTDDAEWKEWVLPDGTPCKIPGYIKVRKRDGHWYLFDDEDTDLAVQPKGALYFDQIHFPLMERGIEHDDFSDLEQIITNNMWSAYPSPGAHIPLDDAGLAKLAAGARALRQSTDRAIIGLFGGNLFELPQWLYRMDNYLMYMGLYADKVIELSEKLCELYLRNLEKWLGAVGPYIDIILFGDDLGGQTGPLMSPAMYREYYKPYHKTMWMRAKELADVKVNLHTCGGLDPLLDDLIDAGLDAINPVQISCTGMEAEYLKSKYGDRLCFWGGGCDTRDVLPLGSPQEVGRHVKRQVKTFSQGGGFVFQQVHNVQADISPENVVAMFEAVRD
ncbi:MAG: methyltransferase [Chloroflexi bacterium]|nr:methyltransferase [Chloroflexota bacterium]